MAMELFKLLGKIAIDNSEANEALDETGKKGKDAQSKLGRAFGVVGKGALAAGKAIGAGMLAGGAAVGALVTKSVQSFAEYEQLVGGVDTLFGTGGKNLDQYTEAIGASTESIKKFQKANGLAADGIIGPKTLAAIEKSYKSLNTASTTVTNNASKAFKTAGLSANEYMETVTGFSASLISSLGGDTEKAASLADQAIIDMADNANKMGTDMASIQNAYQGFAKQNYTMLDNLKLGYGGTKEEMQRLLEDAEKLTGKKYDVSNFADITEAIHAIQTEMGITGTTATEASSTISGSIASMGASWQNLLTAISADDMPFDQYIEDFVASVATVADNLIPRIGTALGGVASLVSQLAPIIAEKLPGLIGELLPSVITAATSLINSLVEAAPAIMEALIGCFPALMNAMITLFMALVEALPELVNLIIEALPALIEALVAALPELLPALIDGLVSMIVTLCANFADIIQPIIDYLPEIIVSIVNALLENLPALLEGLVQLVAAIVVALPEIYNALVIALDTLLDGWIASLVEWAAPLIEAVSAWWEGVKTSASEKWEEIRTAVSEKASAIWTDVTTKFSEIWTSLTATMGEIWTAITTKFTEIKTAVFNTVGGIWTDVTTKFTEIWTNLTSTVTSIWSDVTTKFTEIKTSVTDTVSGLWTSVTDYFSNMWTNLTETVSGIWESITGKFTEIKTNVTDTVSGIFDGVTGKFTEIWTSVTTTWEGIKSSIQTPIESARDLVSNAVEKVKGFFTGWSITWPKIPMPHFGITPEGWKIGDLLDGTIPKLGITWYAQAMNAPMIMTKPTIFGYNGATGELLGGGEAGSEVVSGTGTLMNMIRAAVAGQMDVLAYYMQQLLDLLASYFPQIIEAAGHDIVTNDGVIIGRYAPLLDEEFGKIQRGKERGR